MDLGASFEEYHWLSFADGKLPKGTQFLGAVMVKAPTFILAVQKTHMIGVNPGGEVQGVSFAESDLADEWKPHLNKLLSKDFIDEIEKTIRHDFSRHS